MPTQLNGQFDLSSTTETIALPGNTDIASFTDENTTDTASAFTATIDWGDGSATAGTVTGSNGSFEVDGGHTYADEGIFPASVTVVRNADGSQLLMQGGVTVDDTDNLTGHSAPTISGNPNQALTNVTVATFTDSNTQNVVSDFAVTIDWGDGTTSAGTLSGSAGSFSVTGSHTYASAGQFTITTFMNEDAPTENGPGIATTQAGIGFGGNETLHAATEFSPVTAGSEVATFADNANLPASDYTATIDWGDGTTTTGTVSGSSGSYTVTSAVDHSYADEGNFTLTASITRTTDNATIAASGNVAVDEADAITASGTTINSPTLALNNVTVATFNDTASANIASDFVATIDWGDGTTSAGTISGGSGIFTVTGSHTYAQGGQDTINVLVQDDSPGTANDTAQSTAVVGLGGQAQDINTPEGSPANFITAVFTDGDTSDQASDFSAQIDWGDGTTTPGTVSGSNGNFSVSGTHEYADEGNDAVTTAVTRIADQQHLTMTGTAAVTESDMLQVTANNFSGNPGQPFTNVPVASFTTTYFGNIAGDFLATIDWGDGTASAGTISGGGGNFIVTGSHTYTTGGNDIVTVTVVDDAPGTASGTGSGTATINLAGQMVLNSATEHVALANNTTVATFSDSTPGDTPSSFSATIDWGDGTTSAGTVAGSAGSFSVQGGHTYADEGNDQASVTLTRTADQAKSTVSGAVALAENDSLLAQSASFSAVRGSAFNGTVATFSDSDHVTAASDFLATINWGDGTTTAGAVSGSNGAFSVSGSHTYTTSGQNTFTVTVSDDAPGTASASASGTATVDAVPVAQNGTASGNEDTPINGTAVATDADTAQAQLTYSLVGANGGATHGTVSMNTHGGFTYTPAANFNGNDSFSFKANDGTFDSNVAAISLTVDPVDDAPVITSNGGGDTASVSVVERTTAVTTVVATDIDSASVTYSISGGSDAAKFAIDSATGALAFITAPNFDSPTDSDHNNSYIVQVSASDGTLADNQTITVNVTDNPNVASTLHWMASVDAGAHPAGWLPAGIGDFNADGTSDLAWFNASTGDLDIWKLANGAWSGSSDVGSHPAGYQPVGFGDYNGDHTSDVLWFNPTTRDADLWKIVNGQWAGSVDIGTHPAGYQPALSGDFNGDGTSDIAWYNPTTNDIDIWKISNGQWAGSVDVGSHPAGYQPVLAGDFNGDGTSDIAWYNPTTHDLDIWLIKNGQWAGSVDAGSHPAGWQPLGAADFSQDGTSDIAWYNPTTNDIDVWLIKDGHWSASFDIGQHPGAAPGTAPLPGGGSSAPQSGGGSPSPAAQSVLAIGVGDFDHSGINDIMWRDTGTGHVDNWLLAYS